LQLYSHFNSIYNDAIIFHFHNNTKTHFTLNYKQFINGEMDNLCRFGIPANNVASFISKTNLSGDTIMQDGSITCSIELLSVYIEVMQTLFKLTAEKLAPARQLCKSSTWPQLRSMTSNINNWLYEVAVLLSQKLSRPPSHPLDQDIIL
jgi:hypothetical protein